ncbi:glycoside hydrolase [Colletotrichum truncatum]|uniref:Glycoside hydrolase n=1 Tax=Colletotrichum truncatum TaxID=5467 RepID=A0ACC3YKC3_COLTU|nr:glycoside hydrolase [Colletotrichum truncatum]KAF6797394.1 glycoside hydrolase [Colletotrichum truncatum]
MAQIPHDAESTAAGVLVYSIVCLLASCLVIWLAWQHHERISYVNCLAYFTALSTLCSIIQQIRLIIYWENIMAERFDYASANFGNPELVISNSAMGPDLVLYYIQYYCYNVLALFELFWAFALAQSVYGLNEKPKLKKPLKIINRSGKIFSILFPLITTTSLQSPGIRQNFGGFLLLAGQPLLWSIGFGSLAILSILIRYIQSRRKLQNLNVDYGQSSSTRGSKGRNPRKPGIYDRWLMTRFMISFVILTVFELTIILFSMSARKNIESDTQRALPDFSSKRAKQDFLLFMPGVTASLLVFFVFGTTRPFLEYMRKCLFSPWRRRKSTSTDALPLRSIQSKSKEAEGYEVAVPEISYQRDLRSIVIDGPDGRKTYEVWVYAGSPNSRIMGDYQQYPFHQDRSMAPSGKRG